MQSSIAPISVATPDGTCPTYVFRPQHGTGPWPCVLVYMDGIGIRPALFELAQRIASAGYVAVLPDLFYRAGAYTAPDPKNLFSDLEFRKAWFAKYIATANQANVMSDTVAFLALIDSMSDVRGPTIATTGYCMGGRLALAAAASYPDRVVLAASWHGGAVGSDLPDGPHTRAAAMKARVYVAAASNDPPLQTLADALQAGGVQHTIETWPAQHGWVPTDTPVHDREQSDRHYRVLGELLAATLQ